MSDSADQSIDVHDPEFWSKILPAQTSIASKLQERLEDPDFKDPNAFMLELKAALRDQLQAKVDMNGYSHEEEELMISLISQVSQHSAFSKKQRQTAVRWMNDLYKSTRSSRTRTSAPLIQSDSEEEAKKKQPISAYSSFHGSGSLCGVCGLEGGGWFCTGPCRRSFHSGCLQGNTVPASEVENEELNKDLVLGRIGEKWQCEDCNNKQGTCVICGQKGLYRFPQDPQDAASHLKSDYVILCSVFSCGKAMHAQCFKMVGKRFTCPAHTCDICGSADDPGTLLQCVKCTIAFHKSCSLTEAVRVNKRYALCSEHAVGYERVVYGQKGRNKALARQMARKIRCKLREFAPKLPELSLIIRNTSGKSQKEAIFTVNSTPESSKELPTTPSKRQNVSEAMGTSKRPCSLSCRYCGLSPGSLSPGPWGESTLCSLHNEQWSAGLLDLSAVEGTEVVLGDKEMCVEEASVATSTS